MKMKKCYSSAEILLPDFNVTNPEKWAVIACDQFTSQPEYWQSAAEKIGDAPSTLNMILPEVYLSETEERIPKVNATMKKYAEEVLLSHPDSMIYIERTQSDGSIRQGLLLAVDLECYDYNKGADSLIRATEATVVERIPPRVAIRRDACLELPHIMLLIDDPKRTVIEPLAECAGKSAAYDTELMLNGGHINGYFLDRSAQEKVGQALDALTSPEAMAERYGDASLAPLLFAVGDGNHSLASAKAAYEEVKAALGAEAAASHPARYALAEVVNIHADSLKFEPIYRVVFGVDTADMLTKLDSYLASLKGQAGAQEIEYLTASSSGKLLAATPVRQLTVGTLQDFIDDYVKSVKGAEVDYIHGEDSVRQLVAKENTVGFIFSGMGKSELFKTVIYDGALPRKTFSMGHAEDKRYYMECRKIK